LDEIKSCIDCLNCKYTKTNGVYCKQGQWMTDEGHEFKYKTLLSANLQNFRMIESVKNGKLCLHVFLRRADTCQLYEENQ